MPGKVGRPRKVRNFTVTAPMGTAPEGAYLPMQVVIGNMPPKARVTLKALLAGLQDTGAKLESGRIVGANPEALIWILENMAEGQ